LAKTSKTATTKRLLKQVKARSNGTTKKSEPLRPQAPPTTAKPKPDSKPAPKIAPKVVQKPDQPKPTPPPPPKPNNAVLVGRKTARCYAAAAWYAAQHDGRKAILRARGYAILTAIQATQICVEAGAKIEGTQLGIDRLVGQDGKPSNVSAIEIRLAW